jgi:phosphatidylinositol alpha-1,6-mannosyltransferase
MISNHPSNFRRRRPVRGIATDYYRDDLVAGEPGGPSHRPREGAAAPDRPRVLLITPDYPPGAGGIQLMASRLVGSFRSVAPGVVTRAPVQGTTVGEPHVVRVPRRGSQLVSVLALNAAAVRIARRHRPDLVLSMHLVCLPAVAVLRRLLSAPTVQFLHGQEVTHRPRLARTAIDAAELTVCVSEHTRGLASGLGGKADRLVVIPPGVDVPPRFSVAKQPRPTIVTVARLADRYKGHDVMLEAVARLRGHCPDVQWIVIGDGRLRRELELRAATLGVQDAVSFRGAVDDAERDEWLRRAHVFAMPSRVPADGGGEGFGIVYLEAGGHSLPVVAGDAGGARDAVVDGETGLLVDAANPDAVAQALLRLLTDGSLADRMGRAGRRHAERHTWDAAASAVERELSKLVPAFAIPSAPGA